MESNCTCLLAAIALVCNVALAEVFKCVDENGSATYRDTDCDHPQQQVRVEPGYANFTPLGFSPDDARVIAEISRQSAQQRQTRSRTQRAHLDEQARLRAQKHALCTSLKQAYHDMQIRRRRYGRPDPHIESDLVSQMRDACSS